MNPNFCSTLLFSWLVVLFFSQDSSVLAQLGLPDMRLPILYTLSWPDRIYCSEVTWPRLDLCKYASLLYNKHIWRESYSLLSSVIEINFIQYAMLQFSPVKPNKLETCVFMIPITNFFSFLERQCLSHNLSNSSASRTIFTFLKDKISSQDPFPCYCVWAFRTWRETANMMYQIQFSRSLFITGRSLVNVNKILLLFSLTG